MDILINRLSVVDNEFFQLEYQKQALLRRIRIGYRIVDMDGMFRESQSRITLIREQIQDLEQRQRNLAAEYKKLIIQFAARQFAARQRRGV